LGKFLQAVERPKSILDDGAPSYKDLRQEQQARTTTKLSAGSREKGRADGLGRVPEEEEEESNLINLKR
jgi:hypothetical protein